MCLKSCRRIPLRPAALTIEVTLWVTFSGSKGFPFYFVNTKPISSQAGPISIFATIWEPRMLLSHFPFLAI